jgi:sodium/proline symporter
VLDLVAYAWAGFGATFGPVILLSLYWKKISTSGAIAGMVVGGLTILIWKNLNGGIFELYEIIPGFIFASAAIIIFSKSDSVLITQLESDFKNLQE